jgi:hypothetical protein
MHRLAMLIAVALLLVSCGDDAIAVDPERLCEILTEVGQLSGQSLDEVRSILDESVAVAPLDIRPAVEIAADAQKRYLDIFQAAGFVEARIDQAEVEALFGEEAVVSANNTIDEWATTNCVSPSG